MLETQLSTNLISLFLLLVTGVYVFLTWKIASANSAMLAQSNRVFIATRAPFIIVGVSVRHSVFLQLTVKNQGMTPAKNLTLTMDRDFIQFGGEGNGANVREFEAFSRPIPQFCPGEVLNFALSQGFNLNNVDGDRDLTPKIFSVESCYEYEGELHYSRHIVDLNAYMHSHHPKSSEEWLEDIEKHLKKIAAKLA